MPFGFCNAPRTFQRVMTELLIDLPTVQVFVDDVLIASENLVAHVEDAKRVLEKLNATDARINFAKSQFGQNEIKYLGMILNKDGVKADLQKVALYKEKEALRTVKQCQKCLGFTNWFRNFIRT